MLSMGLIVTAALVWLGLLFGVAVLGERRPHLFEKRWAIIYALSLGDPLHVVDVLRHGDAGQPLRLVAAADICRCDSYVRLRGVDSAPAGAACAGIQRRFHRRFDRGALR
jgi:hypothetical protein